MSGNCLGIKPRKFIFSSYELSEKQQQIKDDLRDEIGYWEKGLEEVLRQDPEYFLPLLRIKLDPPSRDDNSGISPELHELIAIGVYGSHPNYDEKGLRRHIRNALEMGVNTLDNSVGVLMEEVERVFKPLLSTVDEPTINR